MNEQVNTDFPSDLEGYTRAMARGFEALVGNVPKTNKLNECVAKSLGYRNYHTMVAAFAEANQPKLHEDPKIAKLIEYLSRDPKAPQYGGWVCCDNGRIKGVGASPEAAFEDAFTRAAPNPDGHLSLLKHKLMEDNVYHVASRALIANFEDRDGSSHYMRCQTEYGTFAVLRSEYNYFVGNCLPNSPEISLASLKRDRDKYGVDRDAQDHLRILCTVSSADGKTSFDYDAVAAFCDALWCGEMKHQMLDALIACNFEGNDYEAFSILRGFLHGDMDRYADVRAAALHCESLGGDLRGYHFKIEPESLWYWLRVYAPDLLPKMTPWVQKNRPDLIEEMEGKEGR